MKVSMHPSAVQTYLTKNISKFRPTTTLIISSAPPPPQPPSNTSPTKIDRPLQKFHNQISSHTKSVQFFTSMQHNLKTVQYGDRTLTSSFPTQDHIDQAADLMRRMGVDNNVIGVGNGAAIDLAKACYLNMIKNGDDSTSSNRNNGNGNNGQTSEQNQLVLIPSTLGGVLASASKKSLILDVHEEALITSLSSLSSTSTSNDDDEEAIANGNANGNANINVLIDTKSLAIPLWLNRDSFRNRNIPRGSLPTIVDAVLASLAIAIDTQYTILQTHVWEEQQQQHQQLIDKTLQKGVSCLQQILSISNETYNGDDDNDNHEIARILTEKDVKENAIHALFHAGQLLSFGDKNDDLLPRSMALATSSALLPKYFPHGNWLTFVGSFLPGLVQCMDEMNGVNRNMTSSSDVASLEWIREELLLNHGGIIPSLSSLADGAPDVNELVRKIDDNGALLKCSDGNIEFLERVLMRSLNR